MVPDYYTMLEVDPSADRTTIEAALEAKRRVWSSGTRNPKYIALAILLIGLGVTLNSLFVTLSAVVSLIIVNYFLLSKEEELMESRHGEIYHQYKKTVKRWL